MSKPLAYFNGHFIADDELLIRPQDRGFMLGVTVAEQLRSFGGRLFDWPAHEARLRRSLKILGVTISLADVRNAASELVKHNYRLLPPGSDLGLTVFVTPGIDANYAADAAPEPTIGIHTRELPFRQWANKYTQGQRCRIVSVPPVSPQCWPRELKCRSRFHYYLADREAQAIDPDARAILLDDGNVNEASTANVVVVFDEEGLVSPKLDSILPGVSLRFVERLARDLKLDFHYRDIAVAELQTAKEILLTSTSPCILPVSQLNDRSLTQWEICDQLLVAWSRRVGIDIAAQARQFSS